MNVGSLFSGIGGLDYGLHQAGHRHLFFCEGGGDPNGTDAERAQFAQGKWRRQVLAARWPGVPIYDDVRAVGKSEGRAAADGGGTPVDLGRWEAGTGLLCGGFPCQDLSVAGRRAGLAGERSGLFYEFARIADTVRPRWLLIENVPGLLSSNGGRDFGTVLGTLADIGYGVGWRILDSRYFGVPQRRRRVFIVGALADGDPRAAAERAGQVLAVGSRCPGHPPAGAQAGPDVAVASLSGLGSGGPDDNDAQGGRVIAAFDAFNHQETGDVTRSLRRSAGGGHHDTLVAETLRQHPRPGSNSNGQIVVAAPLTKGSATGEGVNQPGRRQEDDVNIVAFHLTQDPISDEISPAMSKGNRQGTATIGVTSSAAVRRLTPIECERLQALPDNWTRLDDSTPDSRRYSALGDAVTASVGFWLGCRLGGAV